MYFFVFLCISWYFLLILCISLYSFVFLCISLYLYLFICIYFYFFVSICISTFFFVFLFLAREIEQIKNLRSEGSPNGRINPKESSDSEGPIRRSDNTTYNSIKKLLARREPPRTAIVKQKYRTPRRYKVPSKQNKVEKLMGAVKQLEEIQQRWEGETTRKQEWATRKQERRTYRKTQTKFRNRRVWGNRKGH